MDIKIRYNTLCDDNHNYWRILIDGVEHICSEIDLQIPTKTTRDWVFDSHRNEIVDKHHITCEAKEVKWKGTKVTIR